MEAYDADGVIVIVVYAMTFVEQSLRAVDKYAAPLAVPATARPMEISTRALTSNLVIYRSCC